MTLRLFVVCGVLMGISVAPVAGQDPAPPPASSTTAEPARSTVTPDAATVTIAWEFRDDTHRYRFENPSSFDTTELVPHFFEQKYEAGNRWLVARATYHVFGRWLETDAGFALRGAGVGDDYDTFFQPGGDTVVYGTTAVTSVSGFRVGQHVELGTVHGFIGRVGYAYRRDRSEFRPSDSITRHSAPPSESRFFNTDRETTISAVQEAQFGVIRVIAGGGGWRLAAGVDVSPLTLARLTTILPDKYPGKDIVFIAKGLSVAPSLRLTITRGSVTMGATANYVHTSPYGSANRFTRDWFGAGAFVGWSAGR